MIIYAIPGFGTTADLFSNISVEGAELVVLQWPAASHDDTMESYARKFLPQIDTTKPFCLLGVSFGGMLCTELCGILKPQHTFLVSSARARHELPWFLRILKYIPLHRCISENAHRRLARYGRPMIGFDKAYLPQFIKMASSMGPQYFRNCSRIIVNWRRESPPENLTSLHGSADRLILYSGVKADHTIRGGTHAMVVMQAAEISSILSQQLQTSRG